MEQLKQYGSVLCLKNLYFHFVREPVAEGALPVKFISSSNQLADVFTKPATRQMLHRFKSNLNLVHSSSLD
jgi:hypothetical protein